MDVRDLDQFLAAGALRLVLELEPIDGANAKVMPPTFPDETRKAGTKNPPGHQVETYHEDGREKRRVLIDSVASQANRHEAALVEARRDGRIAFPDLRIDLSGTDAPMDELLVSELPHRLADAILRDSDQDGTAFKDTSIGQAVVSARDADLTAILEASPTTLLFGAWFSQWKQPDPLKRQRLVASEVWARDAAIGQRVGSRIDPLGIRRLDIFERKGGGWTAWEEEAVQKANKPKPYSASKPSELNHGNVAPSLEDFLGVTAARYDLRWGLSLAALRRLSFGGSGEDRTRRRTAGHRYLLALALAARALTDEAGYAFRSRCDFLRKGAHRLDILRSGSEGIEATPVDLTVENALAGLAAATEAARASGFELDDETGPARTFAPNASLAGLIAKTKAVEATIEPADDGG